MEHRAARAGAAAVRVPVEVRIEAPVAVEVVVVHQGVWRYIGLRVLAGAVVDAWQLDLAVFEVVGLADAEVLALEAVVFDPACGHAQRQFVFVADTVSAAEAVVAEQRVVAEQGFTRIEQRDVLLVLVRNIEVEHARFEGLTVIVAKQRGVAVEVQAAVDAEDWHVAANRAVVASVRVWIGGLQGDCIGFAFAVQIKIVLGVGIFQLGCEEPIAGCHWIAD
ncbi:hypothetical protein D3C79_727290 [compost metagenome]